MTISLKPSSIRLIVKSMNPVNSLFHICKLCSPDVKVTFVFALNLSFVDICPVSLLGIVHISSGLVSNFRKHESLFAPGASIRAVIVNVPFGTINRHINTELVGMTTTSGETIELGYVFNKVSHCVLLYTSVIFSNTFRRVEMGSLPYINKIPLKLGWYPHNSISRSDTAFT